MLHVDFNSLKSLPKAFNETEKPQEGSRLDPDLLLRFRKLLRGRELLHCTCYTYGLSYIYCIWLRHKYIYIYIHVIYTLTEGHSPVMSFTCHSFLYTHKKYIYVESSIHKVCASTVVDRETSDLYSASTWYDMTWHDMTWHDMTWHDMIWYDMIWYDIQVAIESMRSPSGCLESKEAPQDSTFHDHEYYYHHLLLFPLPNGRIPLYKYQ